MIAAVGRTPSETRRQTDSGTLSAGQRRSKQARTSQPEGIDASDPMALLRDAVDADRGTSSPSGSVIYTRTVTVGDGPSHRSIGMTNTGVRHSEGSGGSSRAAPSTTPTDGASRGSAGIVPPTGVFLVGGSHAIQSNLGLVGSMLYERDKKLEKRRKKLFIKS